MGGLVAEQAAKGVVAEDAGEELGEKCDGGQGTAETQGPDPRAGFTLEPPDRTEQGGDGSGYMDEDEGEGDQSGAMLGGWRVIGKADFW